MAIRGRYLGGARSVDFGSEPASAFTVVSATEIEATAPAASSTGKADITVRTPGGKSATSGSDRFMYSDAVSVARVTVSGSTANVPMSCRGSAPGDCSASLTLETTNPARSLHVVTVGSAAATLAGGTSKSVKVTLNALGRQLLVKRHGLETKLVVTQSGQVVSRKIITFQAS